MRQKEGMTSRASNLMQDPNCSTRAVGLRKYWYFSLDLVDRIIRKP